MDGEFIGGQLKAARKLSGVRTTRALAKRIGQKGFGEKVIGQIERDERPARPHEITWLATAMGLAESVLMDPPATESQLDRIEQSLAQLHARLDQINRALTGEDLSLEGVAEILATPRSAQAPERERRRTERTER